jgi:hypothetical protein
MGKRKRRRKKKNYFWLGIKGFFKLIWVSVKYIGLGLYHLGNGIAYGVHWLARKIRAPKFPEQVVDVEAQDIPHTPETHHATTPKIVKKGDEKEPEYTELLAKDTTAGTFDHFTESYLNKSQIMLIFGKRGSGKSTLGFRMMENMHVQTGRNGYVLGVKQDVLPSWIRSVESIEDAKNGGVVLVDEGAIAFSARQSMKKSNVGLGKLLAIARHKDLSLLFITQNTGMIDKNVLNLTDVIIAKEGSLLQKKMERPVVRDFVTKADASIKSVGREDRIKHCYIFSDEFEGLVEISLPSFWSTKISKNQA